MTTTATTTQRKEVDEEYPYLGVKPLGLGVVATTTASPHTPPEKTSCLVGPEGGFSKKEEQLYESLGLEKVQLGQNILPAWIAGYTFFAHNLT